MSTGVIKKVAGPLVIAEGMRDANMYDVVRVSESRLIGEIIEMHGDQSEDDPDFHSIRVAKEYELWERQCIQKQSVICLKQY